MLAVLLKPWPMTDGTFWIKVKNSAEQHQDRHSSVNNKKADRVEKLYKKKEWRFWKEVERHM